MPMREAEAPLHLPAAQADPSSILGFSENIYQREASCSTEIGISSRKTPLMSAEERT